MEQIKKMAEKIRRGDINFQIIRDVKIQEQAIVAAGKITDEFKAIRTVYNKDIAYWCNRNVDIKDFVEDAGYKFNKAASTERWPMYEKGESKLLLTDGNTVQFVKTGEKQNLFDFVRSNFTKENPGMSDTAHLVNEVARRNGLGYHRPPAERSQGAAAAEPALRKTDVKEFKMSDYRVEALDPKKNYLVEKRGITPDTLENPLFKGAIMQGNKVERESWQNNVIYPFKRHQRDEMQTLLQQYGKKIDIQGKQIDKIFAPGEGKHTSLWMSNVPDNVKYIRVMENPLDCVSHYQMYKPADTMYVATGGRPAGEQLKLIDTMAKELKAQTVISFDRDMAGVRFDAMYMQQQVPQMKVGGTDERTVIEFNDLKPAVQSNLEQYLAAKNVPYSSTPGGKVVATCTTTGDINACLDFANKGFTNRCVIFEKSFNKDWNDDLKAGMITPQVYKTLEVNKVAEVGMKM